MPGTGPAVTMQPNPPTAGEEQTVAAAGATPLTVQVYIDGNLLHSWDCPSTSPCSDTFSIPGDAAGKEFKVIATDGNDSLTTVTKAISAS